MKKILFGVILSCLSITYLSAQGDNHSKIWLDYVWGQQKNEATLLPDFSYAGYHHAEKGVPDVNYPIFNVCDYGAVPNDHFSDREAVEKAIVAAEKNGSGIIFFPKGRYHLHEMGDPDTSIAIRSSNIVFRGEGAGADGTEIFMNKPNRAPNPAEKWTSANLFNFSGRAFAPKLTEVTEDAPKGGFSVKVKDTKSLKVGDYICLRLSNNSPKAIEKELYPYTIDDDWTSLMINGVQINDYRQIVSIKNNVVTFKEPLMREVLASDEWFIQSYPYIEEVGVEDIAFVGNFKLKFDHHNDDIHDGGWKFLEFKNVVNGWIRRCRFTNVSELASIITSANVSVYDCTITGNSGHNSVRSQGSSRIFLGAIDDQPSQWHSVGVSKPALGTVIWRVNTRANSTFESHASQPRFTLFDACRGGFMRGRAGGAIMNNPNHLEGLVFWNYEELDEPTDNFEFWPNDTRWFKFMPPIIVGFHGAGSTFKASQVKYEESNGKPVDPESLFEAQLKLRLGKLPQWIVDLKEIAKNGTYSGLLPQKREVKVTNISTLQQAVENAAIGDVITLADGNYKDIKLIVEASGSFAMPLVIKAENAGKVTFSGDVNVEIRGNHVSLQGIYFTDGARNADDWVHRGPGHGPGLVAIYGDYCEVADCMFYNFDDVKSAYITTSLDENGRVPRYANIHHCAFVGKKTYDQVINLNNTLHKQEEGAPGIPMYHRVSYCYFSNPKKKGNAGGGIRIGYWRKDFGRCLVDNNLFERQDSEPEIITSKSMENVYYNNTFLNCQGTLNFRHGDKQVAINNFFIGTDTEQEYGGMFVWGRNHLIASNFFFLPTTLRTRGNSALYFNCGPEASEHALAFDMSVINNTFISTAGTDINLAALYERRVEAYGKENVGTPRDIRFIGNQFFSEHPTQHPVLYDPLSVASKQTWIGNIYNGMPLGSKENIEGLKLQNDASLHYDDSKVYVDDVSRVPLSVVKEHLPYNNIEGIDLDFEQLVNFGVSLSPINRRQVGPRWAIGKLKSYTEMGE